MRSKVCVYWTFYNSFKRDRPIRLDWDCVLKKEAHFLPSPGWNLSYLPSCVLLLCIRMSMCQCLVTHTKQLLCNINTGLEVHSWKCHDMAKISVMKEREKAIFLSVITPAWVTHTHKLNHLEMAHSFLSATAWHTHTDAQMHTERNGGFLFICVEHRRTHTSTNTHYFWHLGIVCFGRLQAATPPVAMTLFWVLTCHTVWEASGEMPKAKTGPV